MGKIGSNKKVLTLYHLRKTYPKYYSYQGRNKSRKLSDKNKLIIKEFYEKYSIDSDIINSHLGKNKNKLSYNIKFSNIVLEVGFGDGEYLIKKAISKPDSLFIGNEIYINGISKVLSSIIELNITNILICGINASYFLQTLEKNSIDEIYIINPDPWLKKRHCKRRFLNKKNILLLNKIIKKKNCISFTTDAEQYFISVLNILNQYKKYFLNKKFKILTNTDKLFGVSRYQRKAINEGRKIYQITF